MQNELRMLRQQREALEDQIERSRRLETSLDAHKSQGTFLSVEELERQKAEVSYPPFYMCRTSKPFFKHELR